MEKDGVKIKVDNETLKLLLHLRKNEAVLYETENADLIKNAKEDCQKELDKTKHAFIYLKLAAHLWNCHYQWRFEKPNRFKSTEAFLKQQWTMLADTEQKKQEFCHIYIKDLQQDVLAISSFRRYIKEYLS